MADKKTANIHPVGVRSQSLCTGLGCAAMALAIPFNLRFPFSTQRNSVVATASGDAEVKAHICIPKPRSQASLDYQRDTHPQG